MKVYWSENHLATQGRVMLQVKPHLVSVTVDDITDAFFFYKLEIILAEIEEQKEK